MMTARPGQPIRGGVPSAALVGAFLAGWATSCTAARQPLDGDAGLSGGAEELVVTLERGSCHGGCPIYNLSLSGDGTIRFDGSAHVETIGTATAAVPPDSVRGLAREIEELGFFSLADRYTFGEPICEPFAIDLPTVVIELNEAGLHKRVEADLGCRGLPDAVRRIAGRIDEVAGADRWTGPRE